MTTQHVLETMQLQTSAVLGESGRGRRLRMWTRTATRPFLNPPRRPGRGRRFQRGANYGMNVILKIAENFLQRMPHRMSAKSLRRHLTRMSHGTVHNILCMTGTNLDAPARQILDLIRLARVLHVDETSLSPQRQARLGVDILRSGDRKHAVRDTAPAGAAMSSGR